MKKEFSYAVLAEFFNAGGFALSTEIVALYSVHLETTNIINNRA
jgi:hypothetical protein